VLKYDDVMNRSARSSTARCATFIDDTSSSRSVRQTAEGFAEDWDLEASCGPR
jgi:hypothetical protein